MSEVGVFAGSRDLCRPRPRATLLGGRQLLLGLVEPVGQRASWASRTSRCAASSFATSGTGLLMPRSVSAARRLRVWSARASDRAGVFCPAGVRRGGGDRGSGSADDTATRREDCRRGRARPAFRAGRRCRRRAQRQVDRRGDRPGSRRCSCPARHRSCRLGHQTTPGLSLTSFAVSCPPRTAKTAPVGLMSAPARGSRSRSAVAAHSSRESARGLVR